MITSITKIILIQGFHTGGSMLSICMTYYNRRPQLYRTLRTIEQSALPREDYEVIIVDDASAEEYKLTPKDLEQFDININLVSVTPEEKT